MEEEVEAMQSHHGTQNGNNPKITQSEQHLLSNQKGLTLVEVLAAVVILSLVIIMFVNMSGYNRHTSQSSDHLNEANQLLVNMFNEIHSALKTNANDSQVTSILNNYNAQRPAFTFYADYIASSASTTVALPKKNNCNQSTSHSEMVYVNHGGALSNYILTITACWE